MATRIFDPHILNAQGGLFDWTTLRRQWGQATIAVADVRSRSVLLRWQTNPSVGLPTEPFKVWRRPALPLLRETDVAFEALTLGPNMRFLSFAEPLATVSLILRTTDPRAVSVAAVVGAPVGEGIVALQTRAMLANNLWTLGFAAARITGLLILNADTFDTVKGSPVGALGKVDGWQLVETVGLPVEETDWSALGQSHGVAQGLVGSEVPGPDAAVARYPRGIVPLGWRPTFPDGAAAPPWDLPDPKLLIKEVGLQLLPMLRQAATSPPQDQAARTFDFAIDAPTNPAGGGFPEGPGTATVSAVGLLSMTVASDPLLAVALGYGTGVPEENLPSIVLGDRKLFDDATRSDWDFMVTGRWAKGLDGKSAAVEYAALVPRPGLVLPSPTPADLQVDSAAHLRPAHADDPWLASIRASWERFPLINLASVASFAFARRRNEAGAVAEALLTPRAVAQGRKPIGNNLNPKDPEAHRQSATDGALPLAPPAGTADEVYAVANQNVFGLYGAWATKGIAVGQPPPVGVQILSSDLHPTDPGGSATVCPATLVCDISVDWQVRSVKSVDLSGRLYPAASRGATPPAAPSPAGLQKGLGGPFLPVTISFAGDVPSLAGGVVQCLNLDGSEIVAPGEATQSATRRYRITVGGFSLDYAATRHVGLALEARLTERIAPNRVGPWPASPRLAIASDPRSRPAVLVDVVRLGSLPDAAGESHVRIDWSDVPSAIGYALYESTETKILTRHPGAPQPSPDRTLSQRLTALKAAYDSGPDRRDFVRRNAEPLKATSLDVSLPRGSGDIHLYTVVPLSAGGVEGPWPTASTALVPVAAPRVATPAPPTLEVAMALDGGVYRSRLRVGTRGNAGARPRRIDLYRVRVEDAAKRVDAMGPPIASLTGSSGGWEVVEASGGGETWIGEVKGLDTPDGSWRRVWYRAVAWAADDPLRGVLKGRSLASPAVPVVIPPPGPPDLSPLVVSTPGGDPATVLLTFTSSAPVATTPLGPHVLAVEALVPGTLVPMVRESRPLADLETASPAAGSGVWRAGDGPATYQLLLRRASVDDPVSVTVRLTDPLGRLTERAFAVVPGSGLPLPFLSPIVFTALLTRFFASFSSDAPNADANGHPYRMRVEVALVGPVALGVGQFRAFHGILVFEGDLSTIPRLVGLALGAKLAIGREKVGGSFQYAVRSSVGIKSVRVVITLPDGRTVERKRTH